MRWGAGARMYLDLMKRTLSGVIYEDPAISVAWRPTSVYDEKRRQSGRDWPMNAQTMIGLDRLDNLQQCAEAILAANIPGDFIETGVWRGGACIFMRAILKVYGVTDRIVFAADSFCGFPATQARPDDAELASQPDQNYLAVSMDDVVRNFQLYGLMDEHVVFLPGMFSETLPGPVKQLAILRLDSDLYSSTMDSMSALYPLLVPGGFCIVDDWNVPMCRKAVYEYRDDNGIIEPIMDIDGHSVYWRKNLHDPGWLAAQQHAKGTQFLPWPDACGPIKGDSAPL